MANGRLGVEIPTVERDGEQMFSGARDNYGHNVTVYYY